MWKARESRKLSSDNEKHCSIHIQVASEEYKTSAKKVYGALGCKSGITQQLKYCIENISVLTEKTGNVQDRTAQYTKYSQEIQLNPKLINSENSQKVSTILA